MCTKPFSQTKNKGKLSLVAKSSGPLLARMPLKWHVNGSLSVLSERLKDEGNKHLMCLSYT